MHIDHVGRIPYLRAAGFDKPIFCSEPSAELLPLVLEDALKIGFTRNKRLVKQFIDKIQSLIHPVPYGEWQCFSERDVHSTVNDIKIRLSPAGHILGSAYVEIETLNNERVIFSGDLGPRNTPLLKEARPPKTANVLVIESTYGDKLHESRSQRVEKLKNVIETAVKDKGVVLIPAFSIGRTQELLYEIEQIISDNAESELWQAIEVIVDSPLAAKFTKVYQKLQKFWDAEAKARIEQGRHPLSFESMLTIDSHEEHVQTVEYLARTARPTIVLAASGMCTGGRVVNYLKALIEDKRTDILFVGYQAIGTTGRVIQKYGPGNGYVDIENRRYRINAKVHTIGGYSAHADQNDLLAFVEGIDRKPHEIRLIHGDDDAKIKLRGILRQKFSGIKVLIPKN